MAWAKQQTSFVKALGMVMLLAIMFLLNGCGKDSMYIELVRSGHFTSEPNVEIGEAYDKYYDHPKWEFIETKNGKKIVQFTGTEKWDDEQAGSKVSVQFIITGDESFKVGTVKVDGVDMSLLGLDTMIAKVPVGMYKIQKEIEENT